MDKRIKINDPQDLADKIKACLDLKEEKKQKCSKELQKYVMEKHALENLVEKVINI